MKNKNQQRTIVTVVIFAIVLYLIYVKYGKKETSTNTGDKTTDTGTNYTSANSKTVLKRGDRNPQVLELQKIWNKYLWEIPMSRLEEDGIFGSKTEHALLATIGKTTISLDALRTVANVSSMSIAENFGLV